MESFLKVVILAGGKGKRLWPYLGLKPFLRVGSSSSLLQMTVDRFSNPWILTSRELEKRTRSELPETEVLVEPQSLNTGPAVLFALDQLTTNEDDLFCFVPCDHYFGDVEHLLEKLNEGLEFARSGNIVLFGVKPSCADTGYGYILKDSFVEKPDIEKANRLIEEGALWNTGIFLFAAKTVRDLVDRAPTEAISFDHMVLEKCNKLHCIELTTEWCDLGTWDRIHAFLGGIKADGVNSKELSIQ